MIIKYFAILYEIMICNSSGFFPKKTTRFLEAGYDIRTVQELMGPKDVSATMMSKVVME